LPAVHNREAVYAVVLGRVGLDLPGDPNPVATHH
jgi:hypothetical protein